MLIPWNTDAPLYHFPIATIGLIVVNTAVFAATMSSEDPTPWMLAFGDGMHPAQWVTSVFMHAGFVHLLGNMIFLWGFGLVIEGKLGWWRFLIIYLGLGAFESPAAQLYMLDGEGFALGASGAIYGLLAMALIWAPRNEMNCLVILGIRPFHLDLSILTFVTLYVILEIVTAVWGNFEMSSAMLHLAGALPGFLVAIVMLKLGLVDCENWDIFAALGGHEGEEKQPKANPKAKLQEAQRQQSQRDAALVAFQSFLNQNQPADALALHDKMRQADGGWQLTQTQLLALIRSLHHKSCGRSRWRRWSNTCAPPVTRPRACA
jgi:membrane associated rhomboid family serine protease